MAVDVRREDGAIEVETPHLRLRLELPSLRLDLMAADGTVRLQGARPSVRVGELSLEAEQGVLDGFGEVRTRTGAATRIRARALTGGPLELELDLEVAADWPGIVIELAARNRSERPVPTTVLEPLGCSAIALPGAREALRFFRMGYQSWSPAGRLPLAGRDAGPRPGVIGRMHFGPYTPAPRRGLHVSDWMATLAAPGESGLTLGFLTHRTALGHVVLEHASGDIGALHARVAGEEVPLGPGETFRAERLWVGIDSPERDGIAEWAERCGAEMEAPVPGPVGSGWCSWYQFFTRVTARDVERNLEKLAPFRGQLDAIQIDDGFQAAVGDWLEPDAGFPEGVAPLAREIRGAGFRAGLWLAPFLASRSSGLAERHSEWLLRDARGKPVFALAHGDWPGRWIHALDPTHPEVLAWLAELVESVRGMGFDYLKLDFLYAGALRGVRHDPGARSADAYRRGLAAIRGAAGPDAFVLGCGAPLGPSVGLVDAMRIGADVAPRWSTPVYDRLLGIPAAPAAANSLRNVLARSALHQRLWVNDPDCALVRERHTRLSPEEVESVAACVALSGGLVVGSDDMDNVGPERAELLRRLLPPLGRTPEISRWMGEVPDEILMRFPDGEVLVLRVNLGSRPDSSPFEAARYGVALPFRVYDVWEDADLGTRDADFALDPIPPHACRLLRLTPRDGRARVVGSTLHISAGSIETQRLREISDDRAALHLGLPGPREGRVLVSAPGADAPTTVRVGFRDGLDLEILDGGVV